MTPQRRPAVSAADDGCFGFAVESWRQGVSKATGRPITLTRGNVCALVDAIVEHCPELAKRETWAAEKGREWARQCLEAGMQVRSLNFADWLASGETMPRRGRVPAGVAETSTERMARLQRQQAAERARDEADRQLRRQAVPMPEEFKQAVGGPGVRRA